MEADWGVRSLRHTPLSLFQSDRGGMGWIPAAGGPPMPQGAWQWVWLEEYPAGQPEVGWGTFLLSPFQTLEWNLGGFGTGRS